MATYKVVDADQLNADMTSVADSIRTKGGTTEALAWPDGYKTAIEAIQTGGGGGGGESSEVLDALIDRSITDISNDHITNIGTGAFAYCMNLATVDLPASESIGGLAFSFCMNLTTVGIPAATSIGDAAFEYCSGLTSTNFQAVISIGTSAFYACTGLTTVDFPAATSVGSKAFYACNGLTSVILRSMENVCTLSAVDAFNNTPIASGTGYIYVPAALVDSYKAATNWTTYADQIRAIEDYPEITGG